MFVPVAIAVLAFAAFVVMQIMFAGTARDERSTEEWRAHLGDLIDRWHRAAAEGDAETFFGLLTDDAVFLGTDPTERWAGEDFRAFADPYFDGTEAWTYVSHSRDVNTSSMWNGGVVWWDEVLRHERYGPCRATGVLVREARDVGWTGLNDAHTWKIAHYSLSFLVPNDIAAEVTAMTLEFEAAKRNAPNGAEPVATPAAVEPASGDPVSGDPTSSG